MSDNSITYSTKLSDQKQEEVDQAMAKRSSVFDDPTREIQELTAVIKQEISSLNSALIDLQAVRNSHNDERTISRDTTTHSATVVDDLKNRLMDTTKEFEDVLTLRTENMKIHEIRRQRFTSNPSKESTNPFVRRRPLASNLLLFHGQAALLHHPLS
ncbi:Syntaxin-32 [Raphanus sativus]|nr:Syntaxin-32 [Raphanus sativus]